MSRAPVTFVSSSCALHDGVCVDAPLLLGGSLACFAADVIAPVLLPVNDHDATAAA